MMLYVLVSVCLFGAVWSQEELLINPDMEQATFSSWICSGGCTLEVSSDSYTGAQSANITGRTANWNGVQQAVTLETKKRYKFTAYVKLLNLEAGAMYQTVSLIVSCLRSNGVRYYTRFGIDPYVRLNSWTKVGAVRYMTGGTDGCKAYVQVKGSAVNYLVDDASLRLLPYNADVIAEANSRIPSLRKAPITLRMNGIKRGKYSVEVNQKTVDFPFGSVVGASEIVDTVNTSYLKYQEVFYNNFNWGVIGNKLKWNAMEKIQGTVDYDTALTAVTALRDHGIKVRGHNVFWGVDKNVQNWVKALDAESLKTAISDRIQGVVNATKGLVEHWDVNNENLHGDWYETALNDPNITLTMFEDVNKVDPAVKLYLNEYNVLGEDYAMALRHQAKLFKDAGVPIHGVGIQSHLKSGNVDLTAIQARLDIVAEAGLPILITELSIEELDENIKAQLYTDVMTLFYGHPAVEGIILWGFWEGRLWTPDSKMFEGPDVTPNAAGRAYQKLYHETWRTNEKVWWSKDAKRVRGGFLGEYTVTVSKRRNVIGTGAFKLGRDGIKVQVNLDSSGNPTISYR